MIFAAIKVDLGRFTREYLIVYGVFAVPFIAVYLVEAKKSIVENFAPVLAKIFSPLFLATMAAFLAVMIIQGKSPFIDRDFLIGFDLMLALVLGLVLYIVSARDMHEAPGLFDYLNLALIVVALVIDGIALSAIVFRLASYGISPNKLAALGENIVLFVNLAGLAFFYLRYLIKQRRLCGYWKNGRRDISVFIWFGPLWWLLCSRWFLGFSIRSGPLTPSLRKGRQ